MMTTAGFVVVGCVLMAATALAQPLQVGQVCEKKIAADSGHYCEATPAKASYTFTNTGIHDLGVNHRSDFCALSGPYVLTPGETKSYILDQGQPLYIDRVDVWATDRTLILTITAIEPCSDCNPDQEFGSCGGP
jgi:hypothetical protein